MNPFSKNVDTIKKKLDENLYSESKKKFNLDFNEMACTLQNLKNFIDSMQQPDFKQNLIDLVKFLTEKFEFLMRCNENDINVNQCKKEILEIFMKIPFDSNRLAEIYPIIMRLYYYS
jgi:hypothetical protein